MNRMGGCGVVGFVCGGVAVLLGFFDSIKNGGPYWVAVVVCGVLFALSTLGLALSKGGDLFARSLMVFGLLGICLAVINASYRAGSFEYRAERDLEDTLQRSPMVMRFDEYGGESFGNATSGPLDISEGYEAACVRNGEGVDCTLVHKFVTTEGANTQVTMCFLRPLNGRGFELHTERPECSTIKTGTRS